MASPSKVYPLKSDGVRTHITHNNGVPEQVICKPIDKRSWKEKYWWLISILSAIGGAGLKAAVDWLTT